MKELQQVCEGLYGHDFGENDELFFCQRCDIGNEMLMSEAAEEMEVN
jgi:hypothetical protein